MGLEGVELIMATEEEFGIKFSDDEVYKFDTPGKVIDCIYERIGRDNSGRCASQQAFYLLRRTIQDVFHLDRKMITLETPIKSFIPDPKDKESWIKLQNALDVRFWPKLRMPGWLVNMLVIALMSISIFCFVSLSDKLNLAVAAFLSIIAMLISGVVMHILTKPFRNIISCHEGCIKDLIKYVITANKFPFTRGKIAYIFRQIVIEQLGIEESQYREDARFIEDLGVG